MTRLSALPLRLGLAVLLGLGVAAASSAQPSLDARLDRLADTVDLTTEQRADLEALATEYADADRAALWQAAADVADVLTPDQVDALREAAEARRGDRPARAERRARGRRGPRGMRGRQGPRGDRGARAELSESDREALEAVRDDVRTQTEALVADLRAGDLTEAAFVDRVRAVRDEGKARAQELLPAEAAERMAQRDARRDARRDAARSARADALGLTAGQETALEAIAAQRVREAPDRPDLRPYLDADGRLDRAALREATRERRSDRREARDARRAESAEILTEAQRDVVFLHRALAAGPRGRMGRRRR